MGRNSDRGWLGRQLQRLFGYTCGDPVQARRRLCRWYSQPLGQELKENEQALLGQVLPNLFGYHLLQLGRFCHGGLLGKSRIPHAMVQYDDPDEPPPSSEAGPSPVLASASALPFTSGSLDVVVMAHTLEFEAQPHEVLREVERCLIPEGHVVVLGFSPWSLWGLWRLALGWRGASPWCGRFYSATRIKDWLALLGFDTVLTRGYFFRPPLRHAGLMRRLGFLERLGGRWFPLLSGGYLLVARKRVATLTPIRPRWRPRRRLVTAGLSEPTARNEKHD